jgi:hypothetical protein
MQENVPFPPQKQVRKRNVIESDQESSQVASPAPVKASSRVRKPRISVKTVVVPSDDDISESFSKAPVSKPTKKSVPKGKKSKVDWIPTRTRQRQSNPSQEEEDDANVFESLL